VGRFRFGRRFRGPPFTVTSCLRRESRRPLAAATSRPSRGSPPVARCPILSEAGVPLNCRIEAPPGPD
jgi:hypothetical protein